MAMVRFLVSSTYSDAYVAHGRIYVADLDTPAPLKVWSEKIPWRLCGTISYLPVENLVYGVTEWENYVGKWNFDEASPWTDIYGPHSKYIWMVRTRPVAGGGHRVYFLDSTSNNPPKSTQHIYYLDDNNQAHPYYEIDNSLLPTPPCGGQERPTFIGGFEFDNNNNLYLAHGNQVPSRIFKVTGAGLDKVDGDSTPTAIYSSSLHAEMGLHFEAIGSKGSLYFFDCDIPTASSPRSIFQLDLSDPALEKDTGYDMVPNPLPAPPPDRYEMFKDISTGPLTQKMRVVGTLHEKTPVAQKSKLYVELPKTAQSVPTLPTPHPEPMNVCPNCWVFVTPAMEYCPRCESKLK